MTFRLSQSAIKAHRRESEPDGCMYRFRLQYLDHVRPDDTAEWTALKKGLLFERLVIGASRGDDALLLPKLKSGEPTKEERDLIELADTVKPIMGKMFTIVTVQPSLVTDTRQGHPDAIIRVDDRWAILDLKYTETAPDDRWRGWGNVAEMDHTQALDYVDLYHELNGEWLPFYYLVCGKSGWMRFIKINIMPETLAAHRERVEWLIREIRGTKSWEPTRSFTTCAGCQLASKCDKRVTVPQVEDYAV